MKCCISWIGEDGKPTPDSNDAIGLAICTSLMEYDVVHEGHVRAYPICEEHAKRLNDKLLYHVSWPGTPQEKVSTWRLIRFDADLKVKVR